MCCEELRTDFFFTVVLFSHFWPRRSVRFKCHRKCLQLVLEFSRILYDQVNLKSLRVSKYALSLKIYVGDISRRSCKGLLRFAYSIVVRSKSTCKSTINYNQEVRFVIGRAVPHNLSLICSWLTHTRLPTNQKEALLFCAGVPKEASSVMRKIQRKQ